MVRLPWARVNGTVDFLDQLFQFPDVLTHDDLVDAFAYTDQLAKVAYSYDFEIDDLEVLDVVTGY
jgi:phage terminase large subunit-like protein